MNRRNVIWGVLSLMMGALVYWVGRATNSAYFLEKMALSRLDLGTRLNNSGVPLVNQLPDFLHPFGFTLLSIGLFARNRRERLALAISWLVIDLSLELSQKYGSRISTYIPSWFDRIPVFSNTKSYLVHGTFDPLDLLAICFGVAVAYLVSGLTKQTRSGVKYGKHKFPLTLPSPHKGRVPLPLNRQGEYKGEGDKQGGNKDEKGH